MDVAASPRSPQVTRRRNCFRRSQPVAAVAAAQTDAPSASAGRAHEQDDGGDSSMKICTFSFFSFLDFHFDEYKYFDTCNILWLVGATVARSTPDRKAGG